MRFMRQGARLIAVIPVGHWIHQDAPDEFVKAAGAFLIEHMSVR